MNRFLFFLLLFATFVSCAKKKDPIAPPVIIPTTIDGVITEINLSPLDLNTPDRGTFLISANNTVYKVDFNATAQSQSNSTIRFVTDTILNDQSREFANFGKDAIAYNPVAVNQVIVSFTDGRKVTGSFDLYTSFGSSYV